MSTSPAASSHRWDTLGMTASTLCIAHCVGTPFLLALVPALRIGVLSDGILHPVLVAVVVAFASLAFVPGYRLHRNRYLLALLGLGLATLLFAAFLAQSLLGERVETAATLAGGAIMVTAHWLNRSFCRTCRVCAAQSRCCDDKVALRVPPD